MCIVISNTQQIPSRFKYFRRINMFQSVVYSRLVVFVVKIIVIHIYLYNIFLFFWLHTYHFLVCFCLSLKAQSIEDDDYEKYTLLVLMQIINKQILQYFGVVKIAFSNAFIRDFLSFLFFYSRSFQSRSRKLNINLFSFSNRYRSLSYLYIYLNLVVNRYIYMIHIYDNRYIYMIV